MKVKICDRCKKTIDDFRYDNHVVKITYEGSKNLDWIVGREYNLDFCMNCWDNFMRFERLLTTEKTP